MYQDISLSRFASRWKDELFILLRDSLLLPKSPNQLAHVTHSESNKERKTQKC